MSAAEYYAPSGAPATSGQGASATIRAEFALINTGFGKLPDLAGNGGKPVIVNPAGTALIADGVITRSIEQPTIAGTSIDVTGIPAGVKRVTITFNNVSTNGVSNFYIQLGTGAGLEVAGYNSQIAMLFPAGISTTIGVAAGMIIVASATAADGQHGKIVLELQNAATNTWVCSGMVHKGIGNMGVSSGIKSLVGALDRFRLTTAGGVNTFGSGGFSYSYER